jgi:hypothetical protein
LQGQIEEIRKQAVFQRKVAAPRRRGGDVYDADFGRNTLMKEIDGIQILDDIELEEVVGGTKKVAAKKKVAKKKVAKKKVAKRTVA